MRDFSNSFLGVSSFMIRPFFRRYHAFIALFMRALMRIMAPRYHISGRHHVPHRGPVIFASNHMSDFDPPVLGAAVRFPVVWMAKRELWEISWLAPILDFFCCFAVDPASPDRAAIKQGLGVLKNGDGLVVFPEGRISPDGKMGAILPGALLLALKSGATVVPVGLWGSQFIVPHGQVAPRPTLQRVRVHFGAPLNFSDLSALPSREAREIAARRLEEALRAAIHIAQG